MFKEKGGGILFLEIDYKEKKQMNLKRNKVFIFLSLILFLSIGFNISSVHGQSGDENINVSEEGDSNLDKSDLRYQVACGKTGQPCCGPFGTACSNSNYCACVSGNYCVNKVCKSCGYVGQPCCVAPRSGVSNCLPVGVICQNGTCRTK